LDRLASKTAAPVPVKAFSGLEHEAEVVVGEVERLSDQIERLSSLSDAEKLELLPKDTQKKIADSHKALSKFSDEMEAAK
jgi:hypothetical protein